MATIKSIEEKAKAYDKVREKIALRFGSNVAEEIFSEYEESKDEKIRKALIEACKQSLIVGGFHKDKVIAWLEKQGNLMKALQISNAEIGELVEKNYYLKEQLEKQGNNMGISETTKKELEDNLNKALEKETPESCNEFLEKQGSKKETLKERNICDTCEDNNGCLIPCCAKLLEKQGEQKPTIEMKTPEESLGIDSDTYNKIVDECIYGKQKPTDKIESRQEELTEFEKAVKQVMEEAIECGDTHNLKADADLLLRLVQKSSWGEEDIELLDNTIKFIEDRVAATSPSLRTYSPTLTGKEIPFLKSLKDRVQPHLKQEWSEEDERMCKAIIDNIQAICEEGYFVGNIDSDELIKWLNSLKDRVQPQNSYNPYKEAVESIAEMCKHYDKASHNGLRDFYDNVKVKCKDAKEYDSLYPQTTWKPSGEQMDALAWALSLAKNCGEENAFDLRTLYEQLKKLREK